jgi:PilZ domain
MLKWIFKKPEKSAVDRESERYDVTVRVKSRQLPGFRALTLDVSGTGLQLETEDLLEKGQILVLEMEFDRDELPDFHCPAEVMWTTGEAGGRQFLAGLAFRPGDNEAKLNLARMGTVLDSRSDADIKDLLKESIKLDATREAFFSQQDAGRGASAPSQAPVPQAQAPPPQVQAPQTVPPPRSAPGILIPLQAQINGYYWNRAQRSLTLQYSEGPDDHELHFPDCQMCHDHGCAFSSSAAGFHATTQSESLNRLRAQRGGSLWKHYRFLGPDGQAILEIISQPCQG